MNFYKISCSLSVSVALLAGCSSSEKRIKHPITPLVSVRSPEFRQEMGHLLGAGFENNNSVVTLINGDRIFPAMLSAIHSAQKTVTFETYVFWKGEIASQFADALSERARAGVEVNVILDAQGSSKVNDLVRQMKNAGVRLEEYHPFSLLDLRRYNNRTHRKLLVVDGKLGFTGGVGIADEWLGNAQSPKHWRDSHFRIEGPLVASLQAQFMDNWMKTRGEVLHGPTYFPPLRKAGTTTGQIFGGSPREGSINIKLMYLLSIAAARETIRIENAYFVPDRDLMNALISAAKRGVRIEIIVPGPHIDQKAVRHASRTRWNEMLRAGIRIFEYQPSMIHCKLLVVDGAWVSVGSANFDSRSIRLNDEANMNVLDARFAAQQTAIFERDKLSCREVHLDENNRRVLLNAPAGVISNAGSTEL